MARKRSPEHDWLCLRCECPCNPPWHSQQVHVGGGQNRKACRKAPNPILRADYDAMIAEMASAARDWVRERHGRDTM